MKAAVLTKFGEPLAVQTVDAPKVVPGSVVVRVLAANVISFSQWVLSGKSPFHKLPPLPVIPGPMGVGIVEDFADDMYDLAKGQMVVCGNPIATNFTYSQDDSVLLGWSRITDTGIRLQERYKDGSFAELWLVPGSAIVPIPKVVSNQYAPSQLGILGYFGISYGAIQRGDLKPGQVVIVNGGTGTIGVGCVLLALAMGASRVIAVGRSVEALTRLRALDPKRVFTVELSADVADYSKKIKDLAAEADYPKNLGADLVIDAVGQADTADYSLACLKSLKERGIMVLVGSIIPPFALDYVTIMRTQVEIRGSFMSSQGSYGDVMKYLASGLLDLNKLTVHAYPLAKVNEAIAKSGEVRGFDWVMLEPNK